MTDYNFTLFDRLAAIRDTVAKYGEENFYISFSGGKDSTVIHHLVDMALPGNKIPRVFINTGIEYADIVKFVKAFSAVDQRFVIISPAKPINQVLEKYGYPFKSKEFSMKLSIFQKHGTASKCIKLYLTGLKKDGTKSKFVCPNCLRYQFSRDFGIKVSDQCCYELKKKPAHKWSVENGKRIVILGLRQAEGGQRANQKGCAVFDKTGSLVQFKPLNPVSDEWEAEFIRRNGVRLCNLYYPPYNFKRTGCKGCPFTLDLQEQLSVMDKYLPGERAQCELIWKNVYSEYRRIGYRLSKNEQTKLF